MESGTPNKEEKKDPQKKFSLFPMIRSKIIIYKDKKQKYITSTHEKENTKQRRTQSETESLAT